MAQAAPKEKWSSRWGFILAASGSAIGLGNIVFFSANAYRYGAGAFYFPYLIALLAVGVPLMILEFGLGHHTGEAFPQSMRKFAGKGGEIVGWWAIMNATFIVMYYVTILAWVLGMLIGSFGDELWSRSGAAVPAFGIPEGGMGNGPQAYFFNMISSWFVVGLVVVVWFLNALIVWKGIKSIETVTKWLVPTMWVLMIVLIIQGLSFDTGIDGVKLLFTPRFEVMKDPEVWQGAFGQIFFSLSLGFGIMTAYTSRLDKKTDIPSTAMSTSFLNCSFEMIAGIAIFAILFHFAIAPKASTLSMMFFIVPQGISQFTFAMKLFGILFFLLLLMAGLSSSISLVEALASAAIDKFKISRQKVVVIVCVVGVIGSSLFALPIVVDKGLDNNGTLGLTLLDLIDHWALTYGLLIVGLLEALILGWGGGVEKIIGSVNPESKSLRLGATFAVLIRFVIPAVLLFLIGWSVYGEITSGGIYGHDFKKEIGGRTVPLELFCFAAWIVLSLTAAIVLSVLPGAKKEEV